MKRNLKERKLITVGFDREIFLIQKIGGVSRGFSSLLAEFSGSEEFQVKAIPTFNRTNNYYLLNKNSNFTFLKQRHFVQARGGWSTLFTYGPIREISSIWAGGKYNRTSLDVLHATYYRPNKLEEIYASKLVVTIHDFIPESLGWVGLRNPHIGKNKISNRADLIICVSENTRQEAISRLKVDAKKIIVIHHGVEIPQNIVPKQPSDDFPFLLFVGHRRGYKNFEILLKSFKEINAKTRKFRLVIVGPELTSIETAALNSSVGQEFWHHLHPQSDADLAELYKRAFAHIVTSKMEGFGMTVLESMAVATPVILSDIQVFREIAGTAGIYFDPNSSESLTQALLTLFDEKFYYRQSMACIENAHKFSWHKAAALHAEAYKLLID